MTVALDVMIDTEMGMRRLTSPTAAGQTATPMILAEVATRGTVTTDIQTRVIATVQMPDTTFDVRTADFVARMITKQISHIGIGAILLQQDAAGEKRPVAFTSRKLRP